MTDNPQDHASVCLVVHPVTGLLLATMDRERADGLARSTRSVVTQLPVVADYRSTQLPVVADSPTFATGGQIR